MSGSLNRKLGHAAPSTLAPSISGKEQDEVGMAGSWDSARHCGQSTSPTGQPKPGLRRRMAECWQSHGRPAQPEQVSTESAPNFLTPGRQGIQLKLKKEKSE